MRIRAVALVAVGALVVVGLSSAMTVPKLKGTLGPGFTITLKNSKGKTVKLLKVGKYRFVVTDKASIHNFTLDGPGLEDKAITATGFTGTKSVTLKLKKGKYKYYCTVHPDLKGTFKVS
jgi:plastocyanin